MRKQKAKEEGKGAEKVKALLLLPRPLNFLMSLVGALLGALIAGGGLLCGFLAGLSAALVSGGGQAINDVYDVEVDRRKGKTLVGVHISRKHAEIYAYILFTLGVLLSILLSPYHIMLALLFTLLLILYARHVQKKKYVGNLVVSLSVGALFIYGGLCGDVWRTFLPAFLAFLATWAREILKDVEDHHVDLGYKISLSHILGPRLASVYAAYLALLAVLLSPFLGPAPLGLGIFGPLYWPAVAVADVMFILGAYLSVTGRVRWAQRAMKGGMLLALVAFFLGLS